MNVVVSAVLKDIERELAHLLEQLLALAHVYESARNYVGTADYMAVVNVERGDDDDQAVLSEVLSVAQNDASDVADAESVDKYLACGYGRDLLHVVLVDLNRAANVADEDVLSVHAEEFGEVGVLAQMLLLAVDGNEELRSDKAVNDFQLLLAGVTRDVYVVHRLIDDLAAALEQLVNYVADGLFVAGDRIRGDDDEVALAHHDLAVIGVRHTRQRAHRLALTARRDKYDLLARIFVEHVEVDQNIVGHVKVAELLGYVHVVDHASAREGDLSAVLRGAVDDLLDAVDIRREGRDDNAVVRRVVEKHIQAVGHEPLCARKARTRCVGALG